MPPPASAAQDYRAVPAKSTVRFKATTGLPFMPVVQGRLERFDFQGSIDGADPAASRATVTLDMRSIKSESRLVSDGAIQSRLQTDQYPAAVVRVVAVRAAGRPGFYEADVELDFMGKTHQGSVRAEAVPFERYLRLVGSYSRRSEAGNEGMLEFSLHLEPR